MLFQGSPVVKPSDALVISFPDFTPRTRNPEAFKCFVGPTTTSSPEPPNFSRLQKLRKNQF